MRSIRSERLRSTRAARKARDAKIPESCDVGEWVVVLEPAALGELLHYLLPHFSAQRVDEGASFLCDGFGSETAYARRTPA